jgi:hypothetical protein
MHVSVSMSEAELEVRFFSANRMTKSASVHPKEGLLVDNALRCSPQCRLRAQ